MIFESEKILSGGCTMHVCHATDGSSREVHRHGNGKFFGHVADFVRLENSAGGREVGMYFADGMLLAQPTEWLFQIDVFSGQNWRGTLIRDFFKQICVLPWNDVFHPRQVEFFIGLAEADDGLNPEMAEMIHGKRNFHADRVAHGMEIPL